MVNMYDLSKLVELKEKCRDLFGLGKHSLHMSDYMEDTFRICSSLLNDNSVHFLNKHTGKISVNTQNMLKDYLKTKIDKEDYCLTSSVVLEMYGLRTAKDLDYFHRDNKELPLEYAGLHSGKWEGYYHTQKDNIIYSPENHFYFNGFKFASRGCQENERKKE